MGTYSEPRQVRENLLGRTCCLWSWRRTPHRDRIESLLSRHYLEQEMEQRERQEMEQRILRSSSLLRPPPPPYQRAPSYEAIANCPPPPV